MRRHTEIVLRAKAELRKRLRALRNTHPAGARAKRSERIVDALDKLDVLANAKCVALFWPIEARHEVDLRASTRAPRARRRDRLSGDRCESGEMTFRFATRRGARARCARLPRRAANGARGAPNLDVIVVPAIAVDAERTSHRLRRRLLRPHAAALRARAVTIGVAYDFQLLAEVPVAPNDVAMDWVVTDARVTPSTQLVLLLAPCAGSPGTRRTSRACGCGARSRSARRSPPGAPRSAAPRTR